MKSDKKSFCGNKEEYWFLLFYQLTDDLQLIDDVPSLHFHYRNFIITTNISAPVCPISTFGLVFL